MSLLVRQLFDIVFGNQQQQHSYTSLSFSPSTLRATRDQAKGNNKVHLVRPFNVFLLGTSPWILVNAIWGDAPLLLAQLNYDYIILSSITLCITLSNLAPIGWTMISDITTQKAPSTKLGIALVLLLGFITAMLFSTTNVDSKTSILALSVCSGIVGTMSLVLYFPYASSSTRETTAMASGTSVANLLGERISLWTGFPWPI